MFDFSFPAPAGTLPVHPASMSAPETTQVSNMQGDLTGTPPQGNHHILTTLVVEVGQVGDPTLPTGSK